MLTQPLFNKLASLGLSGFRTALEEQLQNPQYAELAFEDRLGLLIDVECTRRAENRLRRRIRTARFALPATIEDLDLRQKRGLPGPVLPGLGDRSQVLELAQAEWVRRALNTLVIGPTGAGKTFLACALGQAACRQDFTVHYVRTSRLLHEMKLAHADGSFPKLLRNLARIKLLIFDDWLRDPLTPAQARDLLELLDDRYGRSATLVATQLPVPVWLAQIPDPTLSDAILDRLIHNAYRLELKGDSMRKIHSPLPTTSN